jgi:signal transduction histidine kinase
VWRGRSGVLWVATESGLLYRRGRADAAFAPVPLGHEPCASSDGCLETIVAGVEARDGRSWWFGTAGGVVHRIDAATGGVLERTSRDDAHPSVFALYEDADGNLWIGGLRGLRVRQGGALRGFAGVHGIADQEINSIVEDATGDLWLGSGVGIWRVNRRELLAGSGARPLLYNHADGMTADRTARARAPAAIGARDGRIWFATELGLAIVDPAQARRSVPELSPIVERVRFDGTLAAERPLEPLRARPGRGDVDVEFTVPYFRAPHRLDLRYRLVGLDDGWRDGTSNRVARYTNLAPGSYRFVVRASADGVGASPTEAAIDLTIEPHFYQTKTAMLLALLSVAGIVAAVQRLRVAQVRARYSAIVLERMRIARDLHDTLAQSFAALSYQFRRLAQRLDGSPSETRSLLQDTQDLIARSRLEVRQAVGELRAHPAEDPTLVPALREMAKTAAALTGAHVDVVTPEGEAASPVVAPELRTEIARIAQEATTNAIVHGRATRVTVGVRALGDAVEVIVSDDGAGFDPDTNPPDSSLHFGLAGMRERAANIHADLTIDSAPGAGATVTLRAPIKSKGRS